MVEEQTPNTPQTPIEHTVENPMTPEKKVNWMKIVIGIFFGAVLLIIGALLGGRQLTQDKPIPLEQGVIPTTAPQPTQEIIKQPTEAAIQPTQAIITQPTEIISVDELANWETYTDSRTKHKYSFRYPPDWKISRPPNQAEDNTTIRTSNNGWLTILVDLKTLGLGCWRKVSDDSIVVAGFNASRIVTVGTSDGDLCNDAGLKTIFITFTDNNNTQHLISYLYLEESEELEVQTFDKILSTFQFTE